MDILQQIQADLLNPDISLSNIFRKAKVLARQLKSDELSHWVDLELDGYKSQGDLPDYRILRTGCLGLYMNGVYQVQNYAVPLTLIEDEDIRKILTTLHVDRGVNSLEQLAGNFDGRITLSQDITNFVNLYLRSSGYGFLEIHYAVGSQDFSQILDTIKNRLLDFILKLSDSWTESSPPIPKEVNKLVEIHIYNQPQGGHAMSVFDQRGQHVKYQYNAAGNINFGAIQDRQAFIEELEKLRQEIELAKDVNVIPSDTATEAEYHILQAKKEAQKDKPNERSFKLHITNAIILLKDIAAVASLASALNDLIQLSHLAKFF